VESIQGNNAALGAKVQVSADGTNWVDEGTQFQSIGTAGDQFVRISHFGGWLRLCGEVQGEQAKMECTIHLVLKE